MHEDRDDQPGFQDHEQQDQEPTEIAMQAKVIDQVGASAKDEQPPPDDKIKLDGMLLPLGMSDCLGWAPMGCCV
jgi:hypothetical protein